MHKSKNIVHINTKAKRSQTSCLQEVWPFYSLTSVKDGSISDSLRNVAFSVLIYETIMDTLPFLCYNNVEFVYLQIEKRSLCFIIFYS